ncbi:MAG TPA: acyl-CoA dehydrogenase family protein [Hyphomicrobiaceae bacterium]|jgi:alkylation response protein AidB-like acyl-CoA dehydrogenase|nr:acyl-CoA dehydrogenase family protein [Hyphomicrobiaceae bacterium]
MNELPRNLSSTQSASPESRGLDFFRSDRSLTALLGLYVPADELAHLTPHLERLGRLVGGRLDDLAREADRTPPRLEPRTRQGDDRQSIVKAPAYREMEGIAFGELALASQTHRPVLGWNKPLSAASKYAFTYLFAQSEFGLLCPVNMTDSLTRTIRRFAAPELLSRYLPGLLAQSAGEQLQGAMFMTERLAGSDVGATETRAVRSGDHWLLYGDKWFCSNADADLSLVLARPEGGPAGTRGLGLFLMPRVLPSGEPNRYRIVRLKEKLGTRAMPSGEITLDGASAWLVGDLNQGFKQMAEMVNQSRLSNGIRSTGMMRRALHEALTVALGRRAFGKRLIELPLVRRQLIKMILPAEEALSVALFTADCLDRADAGDAQAQILRRVLTPLIKMRACREARKVAGDAMEMRGGNGYIEEWIEPRLLRETHLGSIWEGTTNIIALDVIRAAAKAKAHRALRERVQPMLDAGPVAIATPLAERFAAALRLTDEAVSGAEHTARQAATGLYHATAAALFLDEAAKTGDSTRIDLARLVVAHKLDARDPLAMASPQEEAAADRVIDALAAARFTP